MPGIAIRCTRAVSAVALAWTLAADPGWAEAAPVDGDAFSFVVWGHPRGRSDGVPPLHFEEILERIQELGADLLIVTGDVVMGGGNDPDPDLDVIRGDWRRFDAGVKGLGIPVHVLPGNHDVHSIATRDVFLEFYRRPPYAFGFGSSRFLLLDTVGITQRSRLDSAHWGVRHVDFDAEQLDFLREEIRGQDRFRHLFLFMHHVRPWRLPATAWWRDVHPLLRGGRTRYVFSGTPLELKYSYLKRDGITYIGSSTLPTKPAAFFQRNPERAEWVISHQPDNLQHVLVRGDEVKVRTVVVGALATEALTPDFWDEVDAGGGLHWRLAGRIHETLRTPGQQLLAALLYGGACLAAGAWLARRRAGRGRSS